MSDVFDLFAAEAPSGIVVEPNPTLPIFPDEPRERFRVLLAYLKVVRAMTDRIQALQSQMDAEFDALMAAIPAPKPKGKKKIERKPLEVLGEEKYKAVRSRYEKVVDDLLSFRRAEIDRVEEMLGQTASLIPITADPATPWVKRDAETVWSSTYNTQGWGAHTYARSNAESRAQHYEIAGLKAEVRVHWVRDDHPGDKFWEKSDLAQYEIWVQSTEEDADIAKYKPGLSLKDWLQWCWDRAINPRVMNPYLPWGLEEKLGVQIGRVTARHA